MRLKVSSLKKLYLFGNNIEEYELSEMSGDEKVTIIVDIAETLGENFENL